MSLESCPTCGYALSTLGNHCRHCSPVLLAATPSTAFDAKHLAQILAALMVLGVLVYLIFFR